ncbi:MAG: VWA domain-containing protein [Candidatus Riflebacteria bacterium]|nr:VWA domain-containing protein [Candidatus Riflebacteria bacterium]
MNSSGNLINLFSNAVDQGVISPQTSSLLTGHLGQVVIAGAAGTALDSIVASDVTLITVLIDASSSIADRNLAQAVRDGHNVLVDALGQSKQSDSVLMALWKFSGDQEVLHSYVPIGGATKLSRFNYRPAGATALYDTWCDALASNVAYAQQLRDSGTPCRSIVVMITDGEDVCSRRTAQDCAKISRDLLASEQFVLAFVGVGQEADFRAVARRMGIPDGCVLVCKDASTQGLRQVFQMVSQSAIRASQGKILPGPQAGFFQP